MDLVWIKKARYIRDYILEIEFNDGVKKTIDFKTFLTRKPFLPLKDKEIFKNFTLDAWTLTWDNGNIDIAPESLYY